MDRLAAESSQEPSPVVQEIVGKILVVSSGDNIVSNPQTNIIEMTSIPTTPPPKNPNHESHNVDQGKQPMGERKSNKRVKINEGGSSKKDTLQADSIPLLDKLMKENEE